MRHCTTHVAGFRYPQRGRVNFDALFFRAALNATPKCIETSRMRSGKACLLASEGNAEGLFHFRPSVSNCLAFWSQRRLFRTIRLVKGCASRWLSPR